MALGAVAVSMGCVQYLSRPCTYPAHDQFIDAAGMYRY